ncbi:MAG: transcription-repair coupling factor [Rickettsiales bacterium]|nr:transcription-repair coupling factor [Rickettsiales bacterium]
MININNKNILYGLPSGSEAVLIAKLLHKYQKPIVHICKNDAYLEKTESLLKFLIKDIEIFELPAWDTNPYDKISPNSEISSIRLKTLATVAEKGLKPKQTILTTANAFIQKLVPAEIIKNACLSVKKGDVIKRDKLTKFLVDNSYINVASASDHGEFSVRGSIIDIFPPSYENGFRLDFFGDELESIKKYDPLTQITISSCDNFELIPASEVLLQEKFINNFKRNFIDNFKIESAQKSPLFEAISEGRKYSGMENYLPLFYDNLATIFDYCDDAIFTFENDFENVFLDRKSQIKDAFEARQIYSKSGKYSDIETTILPPESLYLTGDISNLHKNKTTIYFSSLNPENEENNYNFKPVKNYFSEAKIYNKTAINLLQDELAENFLNKQNKKKTIIGCVSEGSKNRLKAMLEENEIQSISVENFEQEQALITKNKIALAIINIDNGFETDEIKIISEADLLGERIYRKPRNRGKKAEDFIKEAATLNSGELVVHKEHGIGKFIGLETISVKNILHDFILLEYRDGDKFYVPVENVEMISRFGSDAENVELDKLGSLQWQERTARVKNRILKIATDLLEIAAKRELEETISVDWQTPLYQEFSSRFPYTETDDQLSAIEDVMNDISSGKPMDRLICGDVGFGKTEVAIRAAFAIAQKNYFNNPVIANESDLAQVKQSSEIASVAQDKLSLPRNDDFINQVAVIAPTTLLCRQHYNNFVERFSHTGIRIKQLSRMVTTSEAKKIREAIKNGEVDIVIGTHALLAEKLEFKNLSLLIIDEEQRFGVSQKERLKKFRGDTHVLTLTATPIPRTLQLSLAGIRDLSLITTPPVDRLAVRTFVMPYDEITIREAILKEHYRAGKSYFVVPRIKDLEELEPKLKALIPEVKIVSAHGRMKPDELDTIMTDFYDGKFDVLLSTTIVESGLDVPTANTIIIYRADMFGLAQLYQLRGRVGRGKIRAYAYMMLPTRKTLTKNAEKRLEVLQKLDTLGAGFTLASYDMDIRGFGNLLGDEQSGNIKEVGVELYQNMLQEAIENLKSQAKNDNKNIIAENFSVKLNLGVSVLIPEDYVNNSDLRMGLYRRLGNLSNDAEIESFGAELIDRFGSLPSEVENLLDTLKIKLICKTLGIEKIDVGEKGAVISFYNNMFANPDALISLIAKDPIKYKIKDGTKFVIANQNWINLKTRITELKKSLIEIGEKTGLFVN